MTDSFVDDGGRRWWIWIALVAVAATVIRVAYVMGVSRHLDLGADATWYYLQRGTIHDGTGYVDPSTFYSSGKAVATGNFPPVYPAFLAAVRVLGDSVTRAMLAGAPMGGVTVVLTALIARRLADRRVAVVAAVIVAVAPVLVAADGSLMSEVVYTPLVALAVLMALEAGAEGGWWRWGVLGVAVGLAALTRQEAVMLLVLLVAPILWWSELPVRRRLAGVMAAGLVAVLVVAPWVARNQRAVGEAAISTVSPATALAGSNCDATYYGRSIGSWEYRCTRAEDRSAMSEAEWDAENRRGALAYARSHASRLAVVLPARELRVWGLWSPSDLVRRDAVETRSEGFQWAVWVAGSITLVGGVAGIWMLRVRGRRVVVLLGPIAMVGATAMISHGNPRFRTVAEPMLAIGLAFLIVRVVGTRGARSGASTRTEDVPLAVEVAAGGGPGVHAARPARASLSMTCSSTSLRG